MYVSSVTYCMYVMPSSRRTLQRFQSFWTISWVFMPRSARLPLQAAPMSQVARRFFGFFSPTASATARSIPATRSGPPSAATSFLSSTRTSRERLARSAYLPRLSLPSREKSTSGISAREAFEGSSVSVVLLLMARGPPTLDASGRAERCQFLRGQRGTAVCQQDLVDACDGRLVERQDLEPQQRPTLVEVAEDRGRQLARGPRLSPGAREVQVRRQRPSLPERDFERRRNHSTSTGYAVTTRTHVRSACSSIRRRSTSLKSRRAIRRST